ncbi:hypothetical protein GLU60_03855 [Nanohaloarchaea archaeon H01]|jgi:asparagine N-glycosylation enzyme membrane subunit Stt3|nr:hypothetical protein [Nanohaloarchaea archaeon H01]
MATSGLAQEAGSFGQLIQSLEGIGFFTGLLPFIITYTIFFFMLRRVGSQILEKDERAKQFAAILSVAFAFFTSRFILQNPAYQQFFTQYLGRFTVLAVGFLALLVILGWLGIDLLEDSTSVIWGPVALALVAIIFIVSGGLEASILPTESQNQIVSAILGSLNFLIDTGLIFILLVIGVLYYTLQDPSDSSGDSTVAQAFAKSLLGGDEEEQG